jgi:hypothetical protein
MSAKGIPDVLSKSPEQGIMFNVHRIILGLQFPVSLTMKLLVADCNTNIPSI